MKRQSKQRISPDEEKAKSAGEVMATIFIEYLEEGKMIIGDYYAALLSRLYVELMKECQKSHLVRKKVPFHYNNSSASWFVITTIELSYKLFPYSFYSPSLPRPPPPYLRILSFFKHEEMACCKKIRIEREEHRWNKHLFCRVQETVLLESLRKLEHRWTKCIELKEDYIEKYIAYFHNK